MQRKSNSENKLTPSNAISTKHNSLKNEISEELKTQGTRAFSGIVFKSAAEKYRISLLHSLAPEHVRNISDFLTEYQKIVDNPKIPLLNVELVILVYKSWKNCPQFIDNFVCLVKKISFTIDSPEFWRRILMACNKSRKNDPLHFQLLSVIISKVEWNEKSIPSIMDLVSNVFKVQSFNQKDSIGVITEKKAKKTFRQILIWIDCIFNQCPDLNNEERIFALIRIMEAITKSPDALNFSLTKKTFLPFFNMLKSKFSAKIIFDMPTPTIDLTYFCYCQNPMLFINQKFFIKEYSDVENCLKKDILIMSFFRKHHFPTFLIEKFNTLSLCERNWLVYVLKGNNLRTYGDLPFKLTTKASHIFNLYDKDFLTKEEMHHIKNINSSPTVALIYCQLRANSISHEVAVEFLRKQIHQQPDHIEYWLRTATLLYNQGIKSSHVNIVFDYIDFKAFKRKREFSLKGKTMNNLIAEIMAWHKTLATRRDINYWGRHSFERFAIKEFKIVAKSQKFRIKQVLTPLELFREGKELHHCVMSYLKKCRFNDCAIFSLRTINEQKEEIRLLTIEVRQHAIYQIKGLYNRSYNENEYKIIKLWAAEENLRIAV